VRRCIGISFIIIGVFIGSLNFLDWQIGRSSAMEMTKKEIKKYKYEEKQVQRVYQESNLQTQKPSSEVQHAQGEKVALLFIPKISQKYSVYWGTDKKTLKKGVGMYVSQLTTAPDGGGQTVLSGHRDTVFYRLDELKENEIIKLEYDDSIYTYRITKIWITDSQDQTVIIKKTEPTLTLTTCYPFNYIGNAPKRYIIQANLLYKQDSSLKINNNKILMQKLQLE
jgi:sortase A